MSEKPAGCAACPLALTGRGFVSDRPAQDGERVTLLTLYPSDHEVIKGESGVSAGMVQEVCAPAGLSPEHVGVAHVLRCRPPGGTRVQAPTVPAAVLREAAHHCQRYADLEGSVIVAFGDEAASYTQGWERTNARDWRGFLLAKDWQGQKVFTMMAREKLHAEPDHRTIQKLDALRLRRVLAGQWPLPLPEMHLAQDEDDLAHWYNASEGDIVALDTEYTMPEKRLTMIGLYAPSAGVMQWEADEGYLPKSLMADCLRAIVGSRKVVMQNCFADIPVLQAAMGIRYEDYLHVEDTMLAHSVLWSELPHTLGFLESIYGKHNKMKHLASEDKLLYNAGDVLSTHAAWLALEREMTSDAESGRVYRDILRPLIPVILRTNARGITVDREECLRRQGELSAAAEFAARLGGAYCGYPIGLGGSGQLLTYLSAVEGAKYKSLESDVVAEIRSAYGVDPGEPTTIESVSAAIAEGAHPLIEARALYSGAQQILSHYIKPFLASSTGRIWPEFKVHAQANARWSITNPPLQQLTGDLKKLLKPDKGYGWYMWDYDQAELRVVTALAGDEVMQEAFDNDWDIHTLNMCGALGYDLPPSLAKPYDSELCGDWMREYSFVNKDDIRRTFTKRFIFRLLYGGDPRFAGDIPGAKKLRLDGKALVEASRKWLRAHPAIAQYWRQIEHTVLKTGISRNIFGRPRRIMTDNVAERRRIAYNQPMQASVADIKNIVVGSVAAQFPDDVCSFSYEVHDFLCFNVRLDCWDEVTPFLRAQAGRTWYAGERPFVIKATFKEVRP